MDIGGAFFLIALLVIISLWIWAGYRANLQGEFSGIVLFFFHLIGAVATVSLLWLIMVYPYADCKEPLCGFEYVLMWMISSLIILVVWPLVLVAILNKKFPKFQKIKTSSEHILDDGE